MKDFSYVWVYEKKSKEVFFVCMFGYIKKVTSFKYVLASKNVTIFSYIWAYKSSNDFFRLFGHIKPDDDRN